MTKFIDFDFYQIDIRLFLEDMTPEQAETLLGGYWESSQDYPYIYLGDNKSKKQTIGGDNKYSNQKINTIDNSKKTYFNGVLIPRKGNTVVISG
jgi:hypothetical protein